MKVSIDNWSKGLWTAGPPSKTPPGTLTRMENVQVMDEGTVATRPGCSLAVSLINTVDGQFVANQHFYKDKFGAVYRDATALGFTQGGRRLRCEGMSVLGLANDITFFPICMKKYYLPTGAVSSVVQNWGIHVTPAALTSVDLAVAGNLTGNYYYKTAFYNSKAKTISNLSPASAVLNLVASQARVSNIPTTCTDAQVDTVRIFRTLGGIADSYQKLVDVALGTATYDDNISDVGLGDIVSNTLITVPTTNVASRYKNRMLIYDQPAGPRYVYPSDSSFPEQYSSILYELISEAGDTVEAAVTMGDYNYVFGQQGIYLVQVTNQGIIYTAKVPTGRGTSNGRTVAMGTQGIYFHSDDGIYMISGFTVVKVSDLVDALFRGTERGGLSLIADLNQISGTFVAGRYYFTYLGTDGIQHTVIFNEQKNRWKHYTGWMYTVVPTSGSQPLVGLPNNVGLYAWGTTTDAGLAFSSLCGFNLQLPTTVLVDIRYFRIAVESAGTVNVAFWDGGGAAKYSVDLVAPTFDHSYTKYSLPLGTYFTQAEVVVSSTAPFTLKMFEADVQPVRKYEADYTRQVLSSGTGAETGGQQ